MWYNISAFFFSLGFSSKFAGSFAGVGCFGVQSSLVSFWTIKTRFEQQNLTYTSKASRKTRIYSKIFKNNKVIMILVLKKTFISLIYRQNCKHRNQD